MIIKAKRLLVALAAMLTLGLMATDAAAQTNIDYKTVDVNQIPEAQIRAQATKLQKAGVTLDEALDAAAQKGATSKQLSQLKVRLSKYLKNSKKNTQSSDIDLIADLDQQSQDSDLAQSETRKINFTHEDSLLFGFDIFNRSGLTFEPSANMAVGDSYVVGIGDALDIDIYGAAEQSYNLTVGKDGTLSIPMVGPVRVGGLTMADAKAAIMGRLRSIYSDMGGRTNASIRLAQAKPVRVSVIGEAFMPGTYTVSSSSSLFNVLYLSGGPSSKGSYRDIQLIRGGRIVAHLDVYDFLVNGKNDVNVSLADGDIVMIPTYIKRVKTGGEFKRIGYFEAKEGETAADMIRYAGGFTPRAQTDHVGIFRIGKRSTEYIDVKDPGSVMMASGDSMIVTAVETERMDNVVTMDGAVFSPGYFQWEEGMTLSGLIAKAGGLKENAFLTRGVITRYKEDYTLEALNFNVLDVKNGLTDIALKSGDVVTIASIDDMRETRTVTVDGEVQKPGEYVFRENLTLGDLLVLAKGLTENASTNNVEIVRRLGDEEVYTNPDVSRQVNTITITRDLALDIDDNSFILQPFDQVFVRTQTSANVGGSVVLSGAFINPGNYGLTSNRIRLSDMMKRAGGFTMRADINAARIYRLIKLSPTERAIKLMQSKSRNDTIFYLKDGKLANSYDFVSINLAKALEAPGSEADIYLCDGDQIVVPDGSQTVRVAGIVQSPTSMVWQKRWNAKDYVKAAGGFGPRAYKKLTYVVHANGESESVRHFLFIRRYPEVRPGSEVVVPKKPEPKFGAPAIVSMSSSVISMIAVIVSITR